MIRAGIPLLDRDRVVCDHMLDLISHLISHQYGVVGLALFINWFKPLAIGFFPGFLNHWPQVNATGHALFKRYMAQVVVHAFGAVADKGFINNR